MLVGYDCLHPDPANPLNHTGPYKNEAHGMACAGLIAAGHNGGAQSGIAGLAPNCKIMPIQLTSKDGVFTSLDNIAAGFDYARIHSADVLSNSWGGEHDINDPPFITLREAIEEAMSSGRNGKGCVVVFASGNDGADYIKNTMATIDGVITVGASNINDFRASYSNFGPELDVVAPSSDEGLDLIETQHCPEGVLFKYKIYESNGNIWTTDIPFWGGYNLSDDFCPEPHNRYIQSEIDDTGSYTGHFGGTSASCPQAAGLAALILSLNPDLHYIQNESIHQVEKILRQSADKVHSSTYNYNWDPQNPGHSKELGYGRINAYKALKYTLETYGGTISKNLTFNEDWSFNSNISLEIAPNITLSIDEGINLSFGSNSKLIINGTLDAQSTAANPITFNTSSPEGYYWDGIEIKGNAQAQFSNCNFLNCSFPIKVEENGTAIIYYSTFVDCGYGIWVKQNAFCDIMYSDFTNASKGIYVEYSDPQISNCTFNTCSEGIRLYHSYNPINVSDSKINQNSFNGCTSMAILCIDSSPYLKSNILSGNWRGIWFVNGSEPHLGSNIIESTDYFGAYSFSSSNPGYFYMSWSDEGGYNIFQNNNDIAVNVANNSFPNLGDAPLYDGYNTFINNQGYDLSSANSTTIMAENNYWNSSSGPQAGDINGMVDYIPFLFSLPSKNAKSEFTKTTDGSTFPDELEKAYQEQMQGNYQTAAKLFKKYFINYPEDSYAIRACTEYAKACDGYLKANEIIKELENTLTQLKNDDLLFYLNDALITVMPRVVSAEETLAKIDALCKSDLTVEQQNQMDIQRAYLYIYDLNEPEKGQSCLEKVVGKSSKGEAANEIAALELNALQSSSKAQKLVKQNIDEQAAEVPAEFKLIGNFPNPFNPSTNIRFSLAEPSAIKVYIYNVLGQKIQTLTKSGLPSGIHQITWDGLNELGQEVTSGLYIIRFEARYSGQTFQDVKRILLIK